MKMTKEDQYAMRKAYAESRLVQLKSPALLKSRPYWKYVCNSTMIEPCHTEWNVLVLRHDDPWWNTHFPPNGLECRCHVTAVRPHEYTGQAAPEE